MSLCFSLCWEPFVLRALALWLRDRSPRGQQNGVPCVTLCDCMKQLQADRIEARAAQGVSARAPAGFATLASERCLRTRMSASVREACRGLRARGPLSCVSGFFPGGAPRTAAWESRLPQGVPCVLGRRAQELLTAWTPGAHRQVTAETLSSARAAFHRASPHGVRGAGSPQLVLLPRACSQGAAVTTMGQSCDMLGKSLSLRFPVCEQGLDFRRGSFWL